MIKDKTLALISLLVMLLLMNALALPAGASALPDAVPPVSMEQASFQQSGDVVSADIELPETEPDGGNALQEPISPGAETEASDAESGQEDIPAAKKSSNTPFFTGAIIAVLAFAGVAVFCKVKGNQ